MISCHQRFSPANSESRSSRTECSRKRSSRNEASAREILVTCCLEEQPHCNPRRQHTKHNYLYIDNSILFLKCPTTKLFYYVTIVVNEQHIVKPSIPALGVESSPCLTLPHFFLLSLMREASQPDEI